MFEFVLSVILIILLVGIVLFSSLIDGSFDGHQDKSAIKIAFGLIISSLVMLICTVVGRNYGTRTIQAEAISRGYMLAVVEEGKIIYQWVEKEAVESEVEK